MLDNGALEGIKVVDLSRMLPGPYCSMILADHGAEVIAIEDKRYSSDGLFFNDLTRNKRHMTLNLKTSQGLEVFLKLVEKADVIIESFRPGVVERLGVDYESVKKINRGVIYCSITGYGQTGPLRDAPGHDVNYISEAGLLDMIGDANKTPSIPGFQIGDIAGGSMNAAVGILLALFARQKTGRGQFIDISMTEGLLGMLSLPHFFSKQQQRQPVRSKELLSHRYACYNCYETKDGKYLSIGALEKKFWLNFCSVLKLREFEKLQYDEPRRLEVLTAFREKFLEKTLDEWTNLFDGIDICFGRVRSLSEVLEAPQFFERDMLCRYESPEGEVHTAFGIPVKLSDTPGSIRSNPCGFGVHTMEILRELGYSEQGVKSLLAEDAI